MRLSNGRAPKGLSLETQVAVTSGSEGGSGGGTVNLNVPDIINLNLPDGGLGEIALVVETTEFPEASGKYYAGTLRVDATYCGYSGKASVSVILDASGVLSIPVALEANHSRTFTSSR